MIKAENLSYSFPHKELYNKISFTLEDDVHCAFIGTNGTGKSTLVNLTATYSQYTFVVNKKAIFKKTPLIIYDRIGVNPYDIPQIGFLSAGSVPSGSFPWDAI